MNIFFLLGIVYLLYTVLYGICVQYWCISCTYTCILYCYFVLQMGALKAAEDHFNKSVSSCDDEKMRQRLAALHRQLAMFYYCNCIALTSKYYFLLKTLYVRDCKKWCFSNCAFLCRCLPLNAYVKWEKCLPDIEFRLFKWLKNFIVHVSLSGKFLYKSVRNMAKERFDNKSLLYI